MILHPSVGLDDLFGKCGRRQDLRHQRIRIHRNRRNQLLQLFGSRLVVRRRLLVGRRLARVAIDWTEDVRVWHPGQEWIWEDGNFGVFDSGINALSILAKVAPGPMYVKSAELSYPANRATPIAASVVFVSPAAAPGASLRAAFDWRSAGAQNWRVDVDAVDGPRLSLIDGGAKLLVDGRVEAIDATTEYADVYARFAELLVRGESVVDGAASQLVADAFRLCERRIVEPFHW